jgi:hypothetical protein
MRLRRSTPHHHHGEVGMRGTTTIARCAALLLAGWMAATATAATAPRATMTPYAGEAEFRQALANWRDEAQRLQGASRRRAEAAVGALSFEVEQGTPAAAPTLSAAQDKSADAITNVQTAGVDEGGIVKRAGDHLVILRRGRLFTVRVGADALERGATVDAYAPGADPSGAWYDELLVSGSTVVVVGYSYARGGTEIGLFELGRDGSLAHRSTYHLRSFDYWSSRNYASRLVGNRLVFYTPTVLHPWGAAPWDLLPGLRRWAGAAATPPEFERILPATRVFRTDDDFDPRDSLALHTVTSCALGGATMSCESSAVLGPAGRVFYVAQNAVYVWTAPARRASSTAAAVFRMPLDGTAPSALKAAGVPVDQLSFLEDRGGHLNVLLREGGRGEGMWGAHTARGTMALLRVPLSAFGDGRDAAQPEHYRRLPGPAGHALHNRYVGDWLLWGGSGSRAWALRYAARDEPAALDPGHDVERIEALGRHALLVGNAGADLHFTAARLDGADARIAGRHVHAGARQGETRTHGFYFHATGRSEGLLGLPILDPQGASRHGVHAGRHGSASVLFLRQRDLSFARAGQLDAQSARTHDDGCKASCVDWYGNARPIFTEGRVFALMGYELVEGRLQDDERIDERRRLLFSPGAARRGGVYSPFD